MYITFITPYTPTNYGGVLEYRDSFTFTLCIFVHLTENTETRFVFQDNVSMAMLFTTMSI
jgi:hypothetical protein